MKKFRLSLCAIFLLPFFFTGCESAGPPESDPQVVATVNGAALREVGPGLIFGANMGAWVLNTKLGPETQALFEALRPAVARFPGGNMSNNYCWVEQKVSGNDHLVWEDWSWGIDVGRYIAFLKAIGCVPMFSLNPFDHTIDGQDHSAASEASDLALLFVENGFSGAYYEVGNENDGSWNPMLTINEYTDMFILLATAVKAVDPSAQMMGPVVSGYNMTWINGFLNRLQSLGALSLLDWVSYHHYGGWISNSNQNGIDLTDPQEFGAEMEIIRNALASRGVSRIKIAVTELNAAIWDTGCTRDQFTINQGLWLADALGACLLGADAANVWIHLHPGADPHSLIDDGTTPPRPTKNYWPVGLPAQTLSSSDPTEPVEVLEVTMDELPSVMTGYAVRKGDGSTGVLIINKSGQSLDVALDLPVPPRSASGRRIGRAEYDAAAAPVSVSVRFESRRVRVTVPATAIVGLDIRF
jgi:hypothetical protein